MLPKRSERTLPPVKGAETKPAPKAESGNFTNLAEMKVTEEKKGASVHVEFPKVAVRYLSQDSRDAIGNGMFSPRPHHPGKKKEEKLSLPGLR